MISIVIPLYKVESYIESCLISLENQSFKEFEVIVVNDGSPDMSADIVEDFIKSSKLNIKLINQENRGVSAARNNGIDYISGEYVCFMDSDDMLDSEYLMIMQKEINMRGADICICRSRHIDENETKVYTLKNGAIKSAVKSENSGSEKGKLIPTDIGVIVNDFLQEYFPSIMDYNFTAIVEGTFDKIAEGEEKWSDGIGNFYKTFHPDVDKVSNLRLERKVGERMLGNDPKTGKPVSVKIGRFGPVVQLGSADDEEKPQFASLNKDQSINTLTLEEALKLFDLPRDLGEFEGEVVTVAVGRFGPYVKHAGKFVSIPKELKPETMTLEDAQKLIVDKRESEAKKVLRTFDEEPELEVLNGRFGVYIAYKKKNYKIPKGTDVDTLTLADCLKIVEDDSNAPKKKVVRRKAVAKKK